MKLLVTGGLGFIGSNFIHYWLKNHPQDSVLNFDKITYAANPQSLDDVKNNSHYCFVKADICNPAAVDLALSQVDTVVHFAAESHVDRSIDDPALFVKSNVLGTYVLLYSALKHGKKRFHHISTDEVYGTVPLNSTDSFNENRKYDPSSPYSASKAGSDHFALSFFKTFGLPVTISNCSNNYGPFQHPEKFIPRIVTNLLTGKKIPVYGQGLNLRDWLYVEDHCSAIETILLNGKIGETYCIGGLQESTRNIDIVKTILQLQGQDESAIEYVSDRPAHDNYRVDWSKINRELGWSPKFTLQEGLKTTIDWYKANPTWWQTAKLEAESFYQKLNNYHQK